MFIKCPRCNEEKAQLIYKSDDPYKDKMIRCISCGLFDFYDRYNKKKNEPEQTASLL